jgi:hypothetical protein
MSEESEMNKSIAIVVSVIAIVGSVGCSSAEKPAEVSRRAQADTAACAHPICAAGAYLDSSCDPCAALLCSKDPYCCSSEWDGTCVGEVTSICQQSCTAAPPPDAGPSACTHSICSVGVALVISCDPCATQLCAQDPYCCGATWDGTCVNEVTSICGQTCQ